MKKAVIVYQSKTGITKRFGKEINGYLAGKGIETHLVSVNEYKRGLAEQADYLLLGCWTAGFMLLFQHPDAIWKQFAIGLPTMPDKKIGLFTTYKIATGSMFKSMKKALGNTGSVPMVELKSRKGNLTEESKVALEQFLSN
jgi:flavodoxin